MIKNDKIETKPLYEPPRVMKLDVKDDVSGNCETPGSGDENHCWPGNSAKGECAYDGSAALADCTIAGYSAGGNCIDGSSGIG